MVCAACDRIGANAPSQATPIQGDGKIVAVGTALTPGIDEEANDSDFVVARYNPDGSLDTGFGDKGIVTTAVGVVGNDARAVTVQGDGRIVLVGAATSIVAPSFALIRYDPDGSLDTTFDGDGIVTTDIGVHQAFASAVAIQGDGKIVAVGDSYNGINPVFAVVRYNRDGSRDTTFDGDGIVTTSVGLGRKDFLSSSGGRATAVAIQGDQKIVVAGPAWHGRDYHDFTVVRYERNGWLDLSFGDRGIVTTAVGAKEDEPRAIAIQTDGRIIVAGSAFDAGKFNFAVARYNADGTLDTTFGHGGIVTTAVGAGIDEATSVALQRDGKIIVAGGARTGVSGREFAVVRYNIDGSLDTSFDGDGRATTVVGATSTYKGMGDYVTSLGVQRDGKIVAVGLAHDQAGRPNVLAVARYNEDGSPDTSFNGDGKTLTSIGAQPTAREP